MDLHPESPIVNGHYQLTSEWSTVLPVELNRRVENGNLVLWRKSFISWFEIWNNDKKESKKVRLAWMKSEIPSVASNIKEVSSKKVLRLSCRVFESAEDNRQPALYVFAIGKNGYVQAAFYFDKPEGISGTKNLWQPRRGKSLTISSKRSRRSLGRAKARPLTKRWVSTN